MPQNITDVDEFTSPCTAPADGDTRNAASVLTPLQKLANRTRYLYNILTSTGVQKIRTVGNTAAMKGLSGMAAGDVAILLSGVPQLYVYRSIALAGADLAGMRYDSTTAIGQWVSAWFYLVDTSGTFSPNPRLDVQTLPVPNRIVSAEEAGEASGTTNATTGGGIFGPVTNVNVETGDLVLLEGHCTFAPNAADASGYVTIAVDGVEQPLAKRIWNCASPGAMPLCTSVLYTASSTGTIAVRLYQKADVLVSGTPNFVGPRSVRALVIRP